MDVKVPRTSNPEILIWENAGGTDEVQICRQIVAINSILMENQNSETSEVSVEPVAQGDTLIAKGDGGQEHLPLQNRSRSVVPMVRRSST